MLRIGITGGIGSGKTTVAKVFETLGIPVYYADDAAKRLMNEHDELKQKIKKQFGEAAYTAEGKLDRGFLSAMVFNSTQKIAQLNAIVHPATLADAAHWMQQQTGAYALKEAALIFESGAQQQLDYIIGVHAPSALRVQRTMQRDNITREEVLSRMDKQIGETIKMKLCDFIITNDEQELVVTQVLLLHQKFVNEL
ncbi:MAG: dephospho-CoA kinase [Ferruginibacter sp.]